MQTLEFADNESLQFMTSEIRHLSRRSLWLRPVALHHSDRRYAGFKEGLSHALLTSSRMRRQSMQGS